MQLKGKDVLIYDIETDSLDVKFAKLKWFGAYSFKTDEYYLLEYNQINAKQIVKLINDHHTLVGYNNITFDNVILVSEAERDLFEYKNVIDLFDVCKKRLIYMGLKPKNYKLKTINETLKLCEQSKGEIDYNIFKKDSWNENEIFEIITYLKQDIILTKLLFEYFFEQFKPLREYLSQKDKDKFIDIKSSLASLSYRVICNLSGLKPEFLSKEEQSQIERQTFDGGHHIEPRFKKVKGNIVSIDFVSYYPHCIMQGNLFSKKENCWNGKPYFNLKGSYDDSEFGKVENALKTIFLKRLDAKKNKDQPKNLSYKIVINALYGLTGHSAFKSLYSPQTASDCTLIARTGLKKLAKLLEENGFKVLYGFTDNVIVLIPEESSLKELMMLVDKFIYAFKESVPFPQDTFKLEVDKELKFIWFVSKNCYLWVDNQNKIGYKSTLLNVNTPELIMKLFNDYMTPKIIKELDINFSEEELIEQIRLLLKENYKLCAEEHNVKEKEQYTSKTSLEYQISSKYGEGKHLLIPNNKGIGVGLAKSTRDKIGVRYCTIEEFQSNKLTEQNIYLDKLLQHLKPFLNKQENLI